MRLGIVGSGLIWQHKHKPALAKLSKAIQITAFCDINDRRKAELTHEFPEAAFETDLQVFVERGDIDAVMVLTPIHLNAQVALTALNAGKDVFVEKPMAHSWQAGLDLVEAAQRTGRRVWVLEQEAYHPRWEKLKSIFSKGIIGDLVYFDQVIHWPLDSGANARGGYGHSAWRMKPAYPLGAFFDGGIHQVAVLSTIFGCPEWVFASGTKLRQDFGEYDHIVTQFSYPSGLRGVLSHSACLGEKHNSFTIWGTKGSVVVDGVRLIVEPDRGESSIIEIPHQDDHDEMWSALVRSFSRGVPPVYTLAQSWGDLKVLFAVEQSIKTGNKVII